MSAIILDTETHKLNGLPIEIAYMPTEIENGAVKIKKSSIIQKYYSCGEPISLSAMAIHHILEEDIAGQPNCSAFQLPKNLIYTIGHNIRYDLDAISRAGVQVDQIKSICTLALSRKVWPNLERHNLTALSYALAEDKSVVRNLLKTAHSASTDILLTAGVLNRIVKEYGIKDMNSLYMLSEASLIPEYMPFGKHKGEPIITLKIKYIRWILDIYSKENPIDTYLERALRNALGERS
ncbi:3'-5' exonuclease [Acinetobacter soli]|uniref:3'-5' exonuclease n=1 Tax=Acinetobacter soli TaxID=487316 RepID=UPI00124F833E|nr:DUF3820 family protein [Acinetobacter soli]